MERIFRAWKDADGFYRIVLADASGGYRRELKTKRKSVGEKALTAHIQQVEVEIVSRDGIYLDEVK